jgi:hypothetical protein
VVVPTAANPCWHDGSALENGDEIGVLNTSNLCCGAVVWDGNNKAITIWGDNDQTTEVDGFIAGDTLRFRVWKKTLNVETRAQASFQTDQAMVYQANALSVLTQLVAVNPNTDIRSGNAADNPEAFSLFRNYPNPFNPETTIRYNLPRKACVKLNVFNVSGQLMAVLFEGERQTGSYEAVWNGRTNSGVVVASGIYIAELQVVADHQPIVILRQKMMLVK